ncbi:MAG: DUF3305 domain-containing protein [Betaproteobacteria bacterium]|nr:MAG: DUF3305 domain-containing protein [Betaproteobacteria bacterium]
MQPLRFPVTVIMQRTALENRWADERWDAVAVELEDPTAPGPDRVPTRAADSSATAVRWRCPGHEIELHPVEAEGYYLNLSAREPKVFVLWRMADPGDATEDATEDDAELRARPLIVTVSYHEAGRFLDVGEQVDAVPMPVALLKAMESFIAVHYRPEPRKKVKRNELYEGEDRRRGDPSGGHDR